MNLVRRTESMKLLLPRRVIKCAVQLHLVCVKIRTVTDQSVTAESATDESVMME
jgi:hypothetical protein